MGKIESIADDIGSQITNGHLDLNNMDLSKLGNSLMANLSPEDISGLQANLPEIISSMSDVASSLGPGTPGLDIAGLMQQFAAQSGETGALAGNVDLTSILHNVAASHTHGEFQGMDLQRMMETMGPLLSAMQPPRPSAPSQLGACAYSQQNL